MTIPLGGESRCEKEDEERKYLDEEEDRIKKSSYELNEGIVSYFKEEYDEFRRRGHSHRVAYYKAVDLWRHRKHELLEADLSENISLQETPACAYDEPIDDILVLNEDVIEIIKRIKNLGIIRMGNYIGRIAIGRKRKVLQLMALELYKEGFYCYLVESTQKFLSEYLPENLENLTSEGLLSTQYDVMKVMGYADGTYGLSEGFLTILGILRQISHEVLGRPGVCYPA